MVRRGVVRHDALWARQARTRGDGSRRTGPGEGNRRGEVHELVTENHVGNERAHEGQQKVEVDLTEVVHARAVVDGPWRQQQKGAQEGYLPLHERQVVADGHHLEVLSQCDDGRLKRGPDTILVRPGC